MVETKDKDIDNSKNNNQLNKGEVIKKTISKIKYINSKNKISEKEIYLTIKDFFKKYLDLDYEFTHEELVEELEKNYIEPKLKNKIIHLIKMIGVIEYSDKKFTQEQMKNMLFCFQESLAYLSKEENGKTSKIMQFLEFLKLKKITEDVVSKKDKECFKEIEEEYNFTNLSFDDKMDFIKKLSKKDLNKAREKYNELVLDYESLDPKSQKDVYVDFLELYEIIKK